MTVLEDRDAVCGRVLTEQEGLVKQSRMTPEIAAQALADVA
jgi:hypothetical protein